MGADTSTGTYTKMNVATVFKQSTTTSARMSTNIHKRTELSALSSSIRFDHNLNRKKGNGLPLLYDEQQSSFLSSSPLPQSTTASSKKQLSTQRKQIKSTTILMESNSILNVCHRPANGHHYRRHSMSAEDERLLKILNAPPDEPLYINGSPSASAAATATTTTDNGPPIIINGGNDNNGPADNLLMQYEMATTSSINPAMVDDYENENLPPLPNDKSAVVNIEDGSNIGPMSLTPQRGFSVAAWNKLQHDLNSPSASCRMRAIRAMNSPANGHYYRNFDVIGDAEKSQHNVECSIEKQQTIQEVMKDVIVYVEYRSNTENRTIGIKDYIASLGAKVNDRLLRNTTHVVFKDGLQSTYNKAKSWNIPIVSILWFEACKKHLVLMNPSAYKIPNIEKFENPDLYEKTKRHKYIQPDTLMKNLQRPISKSKILEELKKTNGNHGNRTAPSIVVATTAAAAASPLSATTSSTPFISQTIIDSSNVSQRSLTQRKVIASVGVTIKAGLSRKSLSKKLDEKPKNTIRSMFAKQLEMSQREKSQMNGTIERITTLNINDSIVSKECDNDKEHATGDNEKSTTINATEDILVTGSLHKRLTRRNSITLRTPSKSTTQSDDIVPSTPGSASIKKGRCIMFTPSLKASIEEESTNDGNSTATTTTTTESTPTNETVLVSDKTFNKSIAMDVCNRSKSRNKASTVTTTARQLLNDDLSKSSCDVDSLLSPSGIDGNKFVQPKPKLPLQSRRTTYTVQPMDETKLLQSTSSICTNGSSTPVSLTRRRNTMNVNASNDTGTTTPHSKMVRNLAELNKSNSCDAILTPTNKLPDSNVLPLTPSFQSLSKAHLDHIRHGTSKSLLDEYNHTFSSKKTPMSDKRKTLNNIAMDIIKQRVENINRNASFNRSMHDSIDDTVYSGTNKATPIQLDTMKMAKVAQTTSTPTALEPTESETSTKLVSLKPLKRKLFAPPSLFPEHSPIAMVTPQKTDPKKTVNQKRKRNDLAVIKNVVLPSSKSDEKKKPIEKPRNNRKTVTHSRRSTMFFETPPAQKAKSDTANGSVAASSSLSTTATMSTATADVRKCDAISGPGLVFTSMHQPQIDFITEAVKKLGKFKLEDKVSSNTTHLVAFDGRRTVNFLKGLIRGIWILKYDWILTSVAANQWQPELDYEMREFSKSVEINRIERQAFGPTYKMDIFRNFDTFYVSPKCTCKQLKELIKLCRGKITQNERQARYIICECYRTHIDSRDAVQLHSNWVLDSISAGKVQKLSKYILCMKQEKQMGI